VKKAFTLIELLIVIAIIAILALIAVPNFIEAQTRSKISRAKADMRSIATAIEAYFVDHNAYPRVDWRTAFDHDNRSFAKRLWFEDNESTDISGAVAIALTTPIAYMATRPPVDPFLVKEEYPVNDNSGNFLNRYYRNYSFFYYNFLGAARHYQLWTAEWEAEAANNDANGPSRPVAPAPMRFNQGHDGTNDPEEWGKSRVRYTNWAIFSYGPDRKPYDENVTGNSNQRFNAAGFLSGGVAWNDLKYGRTHIYDPTNGTISGGNIWRLSGGGEE
jgi:prepilin-type N-terminal cleavage/methylation domain-containing protein